MKKKQLVFNTCNSLQQKKNQRFFLRKAQKLNQKKLDLSKGLSWGRQPPISPQ
jgi:hypothetical protein